MQSSPLGRRDQSLDVIRGLAILLAMGWHLNGEDTGNVIVDAIRWPGSSFGWAGVDLFFVLSGFLVGRLVLQEIERTGEFDRGRFLIRRIFKLWPVLYFFLIAQLVVGDNGWKTYFFQTFFHVQNYLDGSHAHLWSLAVEEHFYLLVAVVLPFVVRRWWSSKMLIIALATVLALEFIARSIGVAAGASAVHIQHLSHFRLDSLAAGVLLAAVLVYYPAVFDRLQRLWLVWPIVIAAGVTWLVTVERISALGSIAGYTVAYATGAAVLLLVYRSRGSKLLSLPLKPVAFLGVYSYAIYIWHISAARLFEKVSPTDNSTLLLVGRYAAAIAVAFVLTRLIEWPALKLRNRMFPARAPVERAATD